MGGDDALRDDFVGIEKRDRNGAEQRLALAIKRLFDRLGGVKAALGDIARAKGMTEIAQAAGLGRADLYKAPSPDGNPEFATVAGVLKALGLRLSVAA